MDSTRKLSRLFNNSRQGSQLIGWPKNRWWNCVQTYILLNEKLQTGKRG